MISQDLRDAIGTQRGTLHHFSAVPRSPASAHNFKQMPNNTNNAVISTFLLCFCTTILCDFLDHI